MSCKKKNLSKHLNFTFFSDLLASFPAQLQLELIEEDLQTQADAAANMSPDEEQLEVLEDIWLKAGEIGKLINQ